MIRQELTLTKAAHAAGLPVPDAYEIVRSGPGYGLILDKVDGDILEDRIRSEADQQRHYIRRFAEAVKALHQIRVEHGTDMPDIKKVSVSLAEQLNPRFCSKEEAESIRAVFECLPDSECFIHGDCHTGNAILSGEDIRFIDMLLCGKGHPVFNLLCMYSHYVFLLSFLSDDACMERVGVTRATGELIFDEFIEAYDPSMSAAERAEIILQIRGVHAVRICLADVVLPGVFPADVLQKAKKRAISFSDEYCRNGRKSLFFSATCITLASGFAVILIGGFVKCVAHTLNSMGSALLKNRLVKDNKTEQYVAYQSDANSATSLAMMLTSLICGFLFRIYAYLPMILCMVSVYSVRSYPFTYPKRKNPSEPLQRLKIYEHWPKDRKESGKRQASSC